MYRIKATCRKWGAVDILISDNELLLTRLIYGITKDEAIDKVCQAYVASLDDDEELLDGIIGDMTELIINLEHCGISNLRTEVYLPLLDRLKSVVQDMRRP